MPQLNERVYHDQAASSWTYATDTGYDKIQSFHTRLPGYEITPLVPCPTIASKLGVGNIFVKDESSRLGLPAFKILGASWACFKSVASHIRFVQDIFDLDALVIAIQVKLPGLTFFAATDGNHGRAVAWMAKLLKIKAKVYVPAYLDNPTKNLIAAEGAEVLVVSGDYDESVHFAHEQAQFFGKCGLFIQDTAFEGYEEIPTWIVHGYSTMLAEADEQMLKLNGGEFDAVVVPVGVGSLAMAVVAHYKSKKRTVRVISVEPKTASCLFTSLVNGCSKPIPTGSTIMSGMNCGTVSAISWPLLRHGVDVSLWVQDEESHKAILELRDSGLSNIGPCGSAPLAALSYLSNSNLTETIGLDRSSRILLLCTEGAREYVLDGI